MLDLPFDDDSLYALTNANPTSVAYLNIASQALDESSSSTITMYVELHFDTLFDRSIMVGSSWENPIISKILLLLFIIIIYYIPFDTM